jgi:MoxR-vWA-beta-propeller ternary system protein
MACRKFGAAWSWPLSDDRVTAGPMTVRVTWRKREPPLPSAAVVATGPAALQLGAAAASRLASGAQLRAASAADWLVVIGDTGDLPWVDGGVYLGWESGVLMPTTAATSPAAAYVRKALAPRTDELLVLLPDAMLVSAMPMRAADPQRLTAI